VGPFVFFIYLVSVEVRRVDLIVSELLIT